MTTAIYGIFEGGGAKGIGHIAGVKAAERSDLEFIGVAGASAGALIASLVAVGYHADELFDPNNPAANLLQRNGITPLALLGEREWAIFATAQRKARWAARGAAIAGVAGAWLASPKAFAVAREIVTTGGFFTTGHVRQELNNFLRTKLRMHHANAGRTTQVPDRVRFRDMDPAVAPECCSLKVIVTDVTNRRMVVFGGAPDFADVEVAEAVCASIAIPGVFKPARIPSYPAGGDALYADGGMVSNLPVWVFSEEKLNYERSALPKGRVPVLAFSLTDGEPAAAGGAGAEPLAPGGIGYWAAVGRAAIFGGQTVAQRFASDLQAVPMPIRLGVTEFDFTTARVLDGYTDAYAVAARTIVREMALLPARRTELLRGFHDKVAALLASLGGDAAAAPLRVGLLQPSGATSFRVTNSYRMENDADDRFLFSRLVQGGPKAFQDRDPALIEFGTGTSSVLPDNMTKYEYAQLRRTLRSAVCLPVFADAGAWQEPVPQNRPCPLGVVSVDSDHDLSHLFHDNAAMQALAGHSLALADALRS